MHVEKNFGIFEEKKWSEFDLKYSEIIKEHNLSFEQIYSYKGVLDNDAFELYKSTYTLVQLKRNSLKEDKELNMVSSKNTVKSVIRELEDLGLVENDQKNWILYFK